MMVACQWFQTKMLAKDLVARGISVKDERGFPSSIAREVTNEGK